jgi:tetratricopeptide (TPR) repeat protein
MANESLKDRLARCERAVEERPDSAVAHYNLGIVLTRKGLILKAEEAYKKALELDPDLVEAWVNLGGLHLMRWDFKSCLEANQEAIKRRDDVVLAHYNLGQAYLYLKEPGKLVECMLRVLELDREHGAAHYYAAVGLLAQDEYAQARRHMSRSMELGHRPTPDFMKAMEKAEAKRAKSGPDIIEIG